MLVLEPIFEADLPPEQYAYRPGRNAQQAVVEVEALLFRGHPEVVDADLADYFGSIPHAELLKSVARRLPLTVITSPSRHAPGWGRLTQDRARTETTLNAQVVSELPARQAGRRRCLRGSSVFRTVYPC